MPVIPQIKPPIFLGGAGRSGTTLLRVILDSHPNIACGPELKVIPTLANLWHQFHTSFFQTLQSYHLTRGEINQLFTNVMLTLFEKYRRSQGKHRIAEKSPNNVFFFQHLHNLFPDSPLVHVIRDGRDVVCSLLTMDWADAVSGKPFDYTRDAGKAAEYWSNAVRAGRQMLEEESKRDRYTEIRYEDIVINPEKTLKELFTFLEEPWDPIVLKYHEQKRDLAGESSASNVSLPLYDSALGRWQRDLKSKDKDAVKVVAGDLLIELDYAADNDW
ncbi:sulfotransferase [Candidatus Neomarinimicrobiota bacterium]